MTHYLTLAYTLNQETITDLVTITDADGGEQNMDPVIPATTTNEQVRATITVAALSLVFIDSDQDITLKTNSSSAPDETITIKAGKPLIWYTGCAWANPFGHNITALYLSNAGAVDANVKIRFAYDATP